MSKSRSFLSILIPSATVFFSSGCIMVLELVAGRLVARHLGSSLYTWTSVIGVVLAGITVGNYLGGRIADRFLGRKALAVLLGASSVTCVVIVILNNLVGEWIWLWKLSWPAHIFSHVFLVFMLPSTLLGTVSPVVAKMALERGLPTGRTVGAIYAWGAAGSIAGTFLAGFYLIAAMGTIAIIWTVGACLLLMAILYWARLWGLYLWAAIFIALTTMGMAPGKWAQSVGSSLALREEPNPNVIYEDESQYCYIAVERTSETVDKRAFILDQLIHSEMIMDDILDLQYSYEQIYAAVTHLLSRDKNKLSVFAIGGGGYVFPRYVEKVWPGSRIDVVEIDPKVTEAAIRAFGLETDTPINIFTMDARNYVDELLEKQRAETQKMQYDFIYEDAVNDFSIPYQLITKEFNDKIAQMLTDNGAYMITSIDIYDSGLFVGAFINTLEQTFPYVYVIAEEGPRSARNVFVVIAAKREINLENLGSEKPAEGLDLWILSNSEIETLREKGRGIVLTDDYAPVENMLATVVRQSALSFLSGKYCERALNLKSQGKLDESIAMYKEIIKIDPAESSRAWAYNHIGGILVRQGKWQQAINAGRSAIEYNEKAKVKHSMSNMHYNMSSAMKKLGRNEGASKYRHKAIEGYREDLAKTPDSNKIMRHLGNALTEVGQFSEGTKYLQQAANMDPFDMKSQLTLARVLLIQERYDDAIEQLGEDIRFMLEHGRKGDAAVLRRLLRLVESRESDYKK